MNEASLATHTPTATDESHSVCPIVCYAIASTPEQTMDAADRELKDRISKNCVRSHANLGFTNHQPQFYQVGRTQLGAHA